MNVEIQPYVDQARKLVKQLAEANKLPQGVIAGRMFKESQKLCGKPTIDQLCTMIALQQVCGELGVK